MVDEGGGRPSTSFAPAYELAAALTTADFVVAERLFAIDALIGLADGSVRASADRADVVAVLRRLVSTRAPTRIRVLRSGGCCAVLAAVAGDEALWSLEITIAASRVDAVMVWGTHQALGIGRHGGSTTEVAG